MPLFFVVLTFGPHAIEGDAIFLFTGTISENGKEWKAKKFGSGKLMSLIGQGPLESDEVVENKELMKVSELEDRGSIVFVRSEDKPQPLKRYKMV